MSSNVEITSPTHGSIVSAVSWFLLAISILAVTTRLFAKWTVARNVHSDDGFAVAATFFSIASCVGVSVQDSHGFFYSTRPDDVSITRISLKAGYASELFFILTIVCAKLSIPILLNSLTVRPSQKRVNHVVAYLLAIWGFAFFLTRLFLCNLSAVWDLTSGHCLDEPAFWYAFSAIHILTDLGLICIPVAMVLPLQMPLRKKLLVLACFGSRFIDIIATLFQISYIKSTASRDYLNDGWKWVLLTQIVSCVTIVTSCVPYMRPLFAAFPSGMLMSDEIRRRGHSTFGHTSKSPLGGVQKRYLVQSVASASTGIAPTQSDKAFVNHQLNFGKGQVVTIVSAADNRNAGEDQNSTIAPSATLGPNNRVLVTQTVTSDGSR